VQLALDSRDRRIEELLDPEAELEQVATGFRFVEGPVWHPSDGVLLFSDILGDTIYRWDPSAGVTTWRHPSHMANGNALDRDGRLLTCEHATSRVTRTEPDGRVEVLASHYEGRELNSPNDIVVRHNGTIYFTDPNSGRGPHFGIEREQELSFQGVYRLDPADGSLTLLTDAMDKPNGLCFSPDESRLYVSDTDRYHIRVFDLRADGTPAHGSVWAELERDGVGVPDGMKVDRVGNLYCTGPGGVHVFDPPGTLLGIIRTPEHTTNLAWGDPDFGTLYITATTTIYCLRPRILGLAPGEYARI
jgi:gluconolactonase